MDEALVSFYRLCGRKLLQIVHLFSVGILEDLIKEKRLWKLYIPVGVLVVI